MANKAQKPVDQLQYRREGRVERRTLRVLAPGDRPPPPPAPAGLQPGARRLWHDYWRAHVAGGVDPAADRGALNRWIHCVSERERLQPLADKTPLVKGSTGQLTANPLYAVLAALSREIERYEDHFGMTPLARMRLGLATVQHAASVVDLEARLARREGAVPDDAIEAEAVDLGDLA